MALGFKTGGRQRGTPNAFTRSVHEAFEHAFDAIGGREALAEWARENRHDFYRLYARMLPRQVSVDSEGGGIALHIIERLDRARARIDEQDADVGDGR